MRRFTFPPAVTVLRVYTTTYAGADSRPGIRGGCSQTGEHSWRRSFAWMGRSASGKVPH